MHAQQQQQHQSIAQQKKKSALLVVIIDLPLLVSEPTGLGGDLGHLLLPLEPGGPNTM